MAINSLTNGISNNPITAVTGAAVAGAIVGAAGGALVTSALGGKKRSSRKNSRKRASTRRKNRKQKKPYTAGKGKDRSTRRIRYTKNNQPYVILSSGKARFIKKSSARNSRKRKGGRY